MINNRNFSGSNLVGKLPDSIPVFNAKGQFLLPGGQISLSIYETAYANMVQDALAAKDRMIGICLSKKMDKVGGGEDFFEIGCAGRITSFEETIDGKFLITLTGMLRFALIEEVPTLRKYKRFSVDWSSYEDDLVINPNPQIDREKLVKLIKKYSESLSIDMDWSILDSTPGFGIVTFFAMNLPFDDEIRQLLLQAQTVEDRAETLAAVIESEFSRVAGKK